MPSGPRRGTLTTMSRTDARHLRALPSATANVPNFSDAPQQQSPDVTAAGVPDGAGEDRVPDIDDIELPELSPHTQSVFDQMDALLEGLTDEQRLAALTNMRFGQDGTPSIPPVLHAVPDVATDPRDQPPGGTAPSVPFSSVEHN